MPFTAVARSRGPVAARGVLSAAILALWCLSSPPACAGTAGPAHVVIEHQYLSEGDLYTTTYRAAHDDCRIRWIVFHKEPGVVKLMQACPAPLVSHLPLLREVCATYLSSDPDAAVFGTLFWGRLMPDTGGASLEMPFRLAAAAFKAGEWDKVSGRPGNGDINGFVRDLANRACIYPELRELFAGFHRTVSLTHVEKVLVLKAGDLPFFPELAALGARPNDYLPFDCMAWFGITPDGRDNDPGVP